MITTVKVKVGKEKAPTEHLALVIEDIDNLTDLAAYRNALTDLAKAVVSTEALVPYQCDNVFFLLQIIGFMASSFEQQCKEKGGHGEQDS